MLTAQADHPRHAIIEQVITDPNNEPPAQLPSARIAANSAWLVRATTVYNRHRAADALASAFHPQPSTATIHAQPINMTARAVVSVSEPEDLVDFADAATSDVLA